MFLTSVQLLFANAEEGKPITASQVLWDSTESANIKKVSIKAE